MFDKRRRPLRNHVYLAFPDHDIAYARATEPAFQVLAPVLNCLAGNYNVTTPGSDVSLERCKLERLVFHGNVELLTARELKRRYPEMKIVAWVQDPLHRLAYCYEKIILTEEALPSYYNERYFDKTMSPVDFVTHVSGISDLDADNLFRSQKATLTYKGALTADIVLKLEQFEDSLERFLSVSLLEQRPTSSTSYRISDYVSADTLSSFADEALGKMLHRRYKQDYNLFYSQPALSA
ncbi:sulfotransferase family 2 domain-containing protein [Roseibium sp. SCP14]|uniref:sulfotransferase family 2 domain-containing protein n=1 Tax=Roseibium sp. SCP14 TaxID=3141375 RepID=UPI00333C7FEA